jgi:broad specificity phosphatase PhoE
VNRRRIYLMRHGAVAYFPQGKAVFPDTVPLTGEGVRQAEGARDALAGVVFDRVIATGLARTMQTAAIVAPGAEVEVWEEFREIRGARLTGLPPDELEDVFLHAFRGIIPNGKKILGGETVGEVFDRVIPALERLVAVPGWDTALVVAHGGVNRALLSWVLTGERLFIGHLEQAECCINVLDVGDEWVVRATGLTPLDLVHAQTRQTTMERYWSEYRGLT